MKNRQILFFTVGITLVFVVIILFFKNNYFSTNNSQTQSTLTTNENKGMNVGENICDEFSKEWVSSVTGKTITRVENLDSNVCQYYVDDNNFITLRLNNSSAENHKKGQITLGRTITTNSEIQMEHFVVMQENGIINNIVLVLNPNLYLSVDRSSTNAASENEIIALAKEVSNRILNNENQVSVQPTQKTEVNVPLPQETDIVRSFFENIAEGRSSDAVSMMTSSNTSNDSTKQAWGVQFNAFKSIKLITIEPSMQSDWTEDIHTYKATLQVEMKPEAASAVPMPNYGWDDGQNIRWIQLQKIDGNWLINGIATGP